MRIVLATNRDAENVLSFFEKYIKKECDALPSEEFLCPFGIKAAIQRQQVLVCSVDDQIMGALRFYPRKRDQIVSVYQFAIHKKYREQKILQNMLHATGYSFFEVECPISSMMNDYYKKTGWILKQQKSGSNYWTFSLVDE